MLGLGKSPQRGLVLPGDWSCQQGMGWVGHSRCHPGMPVREAAAVPAVGWGPLARPTRVPAGLAGSPRLLGQRPPVDAPPLREAGKDSGWGFAERESRIRPAWGSCQGRAPRRGEAAAHP